MKKILNFIKSLFQRKAEKINLVYPISWETMDFADFRNVCDILSSPHGREETLFLCFCKLAKIRPDNPAKYDAKAIKNKMPVVIEGKSYIVSSEVIAEGCRQVSFILDSIGLPPSPFDNVDTKLFGTSFEKYFKADSLIMASIDRQDGGMLKEAVKCLTDGRVRKMLPWQRKAVVIWWNGVKRYLMDKYPCVLCEGSGFSEKSQADILQDLLSAMNNNRPQENDNILKCDVHSVLYSLNRIYEDAQQKLSR